MTAPDLMPVLSAGAHSSPRAGACVMEYVSLLAGEPWSDSPSCTHPVLAAVARRVNDRMPDDERHRLVPLIGRLFGTAETGTDRERQVLRRRLAVWSARRVLHLTRAQDRAVCEAAIDAAEGWCDGTASNEHLAAASAATDAASMATAASAAAAATASACAASAATASAYALAAAYAVDAAYAASAATASAADGADGDTLRFLTDLLDEYDRLTGRGQARELHPADYRALAAATA